MGLVTQSQNKNDSKVFTVSSGERRFSFAMDGYPFDIKMDIGVFKGRNNFLNLMKRPVARVFITTKFEEVDLQLAHRMVLAMAGKAAELSATEISDDFGRLGLIIDDYTMPSPFHGSKPVDIIIIGGIVTGHEKSFKRFCQSI